MPKKLDPSEKNSQLNRRNVLQLLGAGSLSMAGLGGLSGISQAAMAKSRPDLDYSAMRRVQQQYESIDVAEAAVNQHAAELLTELTEHGYLDQTAVSIGSLERGDGDDAWVFTVATDTAPTAHIGVSRETQRYAVDVHVQPQAERAFAIVRSKADDRQFKFISEHGEISTQSCYYETRCDSTCDFDNEEPPAPAEVRYQCCTVPPSYEVTCEPVSSPDCYCG
jgi:hypothetical protein